MKLFVRYAQFILLVAISLVLFQNCDGTFKVVGVQETIITPTSVPTPTPKPSATPDLKPSNYTYLGFQIFLTESNPILGVGGSQEEWSKQYGATDTIGNVPLAAPPSKQILATFSQGLLDKIGSTGNNDKKLALIFGPLAFDHTDTQISQVVKDIFDIAIEKNVAVGFHIDDAKFWSRRSDLWQNSDNIEWTDWSKKPNTGAELNWGQSIKLAPQMCYNSPQIISEVKHLAKDVIGAAIKTGMDRLAALGKPELFSGVIAGWESGLSRDFSSAKATGYCGLTNLGFSSSSLPDNMDMARAQLVLNFVKLWAENLTSAGLPKEKIFGHVAAISFLNTSLESRNYSIPPVVLNNSYLIPGFSIYSGWDTPAQVADFHSNLQTAGASRWALAEGTNLDTEKSMETYLAEVYNKGAVLTNLFGWGIGDDPNNQFRFATENTSAISTYQKFLRGDQLRTLSCFEQLGTNSEWSSESEVLIDGYSANAMEPKTSADEVTLFWNDKPATDSAMNIHYAIKQSSGRYLYIGTLPGTVSDNNLDGVPAIDSLGNFYFVSTRSFASNFQSIYGGQIQLVGPNSLQVANVNPADAAVNQSQNGKLDMDIDVSWDGGTMIASRAVFSGNPYPDASRLALFTVNSRVAASVANSNALLLNVNLPGCRVYAGNLSNDQKELYYTALPTATSNANDFRVVVSKRSSVAEPFGVGKVIQAISGNVVEGPAVSMDGKSLFYHKLDSSSGRYKIYRVTRP